MIHLTEQLKTIGLLKPATDAAGRTGRWVSLKNAHGLWVFAYLDQGNPATVLLTPRQATAVAGTGAKAFANPLQIWSILDLAASDAWVRQPDATSFTTDAGVKEKQVGFFVPAAALDTGGGFDCVTLATGASNVANITSAVAILDGRYPPTPTVLAD
jgi:hypothetical protein